MSTAGLVCTWALEEKRRPTTTILGWRLGMREKKNNEEEGKP
jgi:hypothetical protein